VQDRKIWDTRKYDFTILHIESCTVGTINWLTIAVYMCYNWPRICSVCRNHNPQSWPITALATKATTEAGITYHFWIPEFILPEYLKSSFRNIWVHPSGIPESILPEYLSLSFGISEFTHDFQWGSYCSMILFLCSTTLHRNKSLFILLFVFLFFLFFVCLSLMASGYSLMH
jgi:hypothetical protein